MKEDCISIKIHITHAVPVHHISHLWYI